MVLTVNNIIFAALLAFVITWIIKKGFKFWQLISKGKGVGLKYSNEIDISQMLSQCYTMFPLDIIRFNGEIFKRGTLVRVTTSRNKIFEGKIIGMNNDNIVCMMTKNRIIAHELRDIEEMRAIEISNQEA